jgi:hypothetical protein
MNDLFTAEELNETSEPVSLGNLEPEDSAELNEMFVESFHRDETYWRAV